MPRHRTQKRKLRGGAAGTLELTWKIDNRPVDQEDVFTEVESLIDESAPDDATEILEGIKTMIEDHVKEAGFTSAHVDKNLWIVDVEYAGDAPPQVAKLESNTGAYMDPPMVFEVTFKFEMAGGRRRRARGKKSRRATRRKR